MSRPIPGRAGRAALGSAMAVWAGTLAGLSGRAGLVVLLASGAGIATLMTRTRWPLVGAFMLVMGFASGAAAGGRAATMLTGELPTGTVTVQAVVLDDARPSRMGPWATARPFAVDGQPWRGPTILVSGEPMAAVRAGERWDLRGPIRPAPRVVRGDPVAGRMAVREARRLAGPGGVVGAAGVLREATLDPLVRRGGDGAALLAGFLVGDTRRVHPADLEALRRAGLSHYVAVSGSNVALFLGLWWLVLAPSWRRPRLRAGLGLVGLVLFVIVTRWEPSVLRAAAMAGVVLLARVAGLSVDVWVALGVGVTAMLLVSGSLATDLGFALSAAATAGVVVAARLAPKRWGRVRMALAATAGAQVAVTPLLFATFGTVPLLSPLTNLVSAPLVTLSTAFGGIGALARVGPLVDVGVGVARLVLAVARLASPWPQLGAGSIPWIVGAGALALVPNLRRPLAVSLAAAGLALAVPQATTPPALVVLDVGQGDSVLLLAPDATVLVDGGPDPMVLAHKLADHGVRAIDLVVITHPHADHTTGLTGVFGRMPVALAWDAAKPHTTPAHTVTLAAAAGAGVAVTRPPVGRVVDVGSIRLEVLGPRRRYAGPNDQSIVLRAHLAGMSVLLAADVEVVAQRELGSIRADVLKVPHQGAATSDARWLAESAAPLAIVSVGPNDYGHPADWVIEALEAAGSRVVRTDEWGDVVVRPPS
ncbi:MAG: ComEC/Rec2 family competence protein [Acidimicrobiia bacterium]